MSKGPPSIHDLTPLEIGGTVARRGFAVQDHVAANHCLEMLENPALTQVWCETQDDVTLLWVNGHGEEVEFVQVKAHEFNQLWTIAKLLEKENAKDSDGNGSSKSKQKKKEKHCILEKSLQYDRCKEPVRFRIVTTRPVKDELIHLTHPLNSPSRDKSAESYTALCEKLKEKVGSFKSVNGNDYTYWIDRTLWTWVHSLDTVSQQNCWRLSELVEKSGHFLARDQIAELYQRLLRKVYDGGLARWDTESGKKKIIRADLLAWFDEAVHSALHPGRSGTGKKLEAKLCEAAIDIDQHEAIAEMRHRYRLELLTPKYSREIRTDAESQIRGRLMTLRAKLDGRLLDVDGAAFHAMCLEEINTVLESLNPNERQPAENLYGYMYDLADRCTHRFVRAKT